MEVGISTDAQMIAFVVAQNLKCSSTNFDKYLMTDDARDGTTVKKKNK
jgi:hypothetical protein